MNKIKETKIKLGRTVNIGDFENYKPELEITFEGEVNYAEAFKLVKEEIELEADRLRTNVKNSQNVPPQVPKAQNDFPDKKMIEQTCKVEGCNLKRFYLNNWGGYSHATAMKDEKGKTIYHNL